MTAELPVIIKTYDLLVKLVPWVAKFPRSHRFVLGERIENNLYDIFDNLIAARYSREPEPILRQVNVDLEKLRFRIRLANDIQAMSVKQYEQASAALLEVGRMVGGWLRARQKRRSQYPGEQ
ncbi:MAG: diversity-generating retroelement protein Avd [Pseudomonadota bacterium]